MAGLIKSVLNTGSDDNVYDVVRSSNKRCEKHRVWSKAETGDDILYRADDFDTASRRSMPHRKCGCAIFIRIRPSDWIVSKI